MATISLRKANARLPPDVNRVLPPLQHLEQGDVRHLRQVGRHTLDPHRQWQGHPGHRLRGLRGHLRRQDRHRPPLWLQRRQRYHIVLYIIFLCV
ncbi:hypothetical protein RHSIM_Rhsim08G0105400 [Rhododendron simsii]|uniref:Uncharacterized protein n=1 Tax=Rhododendron simsii TaxID=118357 RepID=A0A834GFS9_RHOSS|nr:hypothetical protein RHSIM_Rhsim08G0105400 [Rhododendron simsii]